MTNAKLAKLLPLLELGFEQDSTLLKALESELTTATHAGHRFGRDLSMTELWTNHWKHQWICVHAILREIRALIERMDSAMTSTEADRLDTAAGAWELIQFQDAKLLVALGLIRGDISALAPEVKRDWNNHARTIEAYLGEIHSCAQAMRIKLELLRRHSPAEASRFAITLFSPLQRQASGQASPQDLYDREYRRAELELHREQHEVGNILNTLQSLVMWVETPEDRMARNRSLQVGLS